MKTLQRLRAFTLVEFLVASSVSVVLVGIGLVASISVQRSFNASIKYANSQSEQARVLDYMALDLRQSLTVTGSGSELRLTIPDYYDSTGQPRTPTVVNGLPKYGTTPQAVRYFLQGSSILRTAGTTTTTIAENVEDFQFEFRDFGQVIEISLTYVPTFQQRSGAQASRNGTRATIRTLLRNRTAT